MFRKLNKKIRKISLICRFLGTNITLTKYTMLLGVKYVYNNGDP